MRFRTTTLVRKLLAPGATGRTPQRWASLASWGCLVSVLPSIGWRVAMLAGADTGFALAPLFRSDPEAIRYVLTLDVLQLGGAIACVGLARRWGERWFSWLPVIGGRVIPRLGPVAARLAEPAHGRDHRVLAPSTPHRVSNGAHPVSARCTPSATSPTLTGLAPTMRVSTPTERPADADPDSSPALVRRRATAPGTR